MSSHHHSTLKLSPPTEGNVVWWKLPIMWVVLGGPMAVVVAGFVTAWIAFDHADPQLRQLPSSREVARSNARDRSAAPAQQVRNHVTTPSTPPTPVAAPATLGAQP